VELAVDLFLLGLGLAALAYDSDIADALNAFPCQDPVMGGTNPAKGEFFLEDGGTVIHFSKPDRQPWTCQNRIPK
jgi:hypothetical protein